MNPLADCPSRTPLLLAMTGWLTLAALLLLLVPFHLRLPLTPDAVFYDACARHILRGGALERDLFYVMPPGMPWLMAVARLVFGTSSVALRVADLILVGGVVTLLGLSWLRMGMTRATVIWSVVILAAFYLTRTEWAHCQPDVWMLLPALLGLHLRSHQMERLPKGQRLFTWGLLEGLAWGSGCLIKPFVVVPGAAVWLVSVVLTLRAGSVRWKSLFLDGLGLFIGGSLMGLLWQLWLIQSGSYSSYWEHVAAHRGVYYETSNPWFTRCIMALRYPSPWSWFQALALGILPWIVYRALVVAHEPTHARIALLAAFTVGWNYQASFIQSQLGYHLISALLPTLALVLGFAGQARAPRLLWGAVLLLVALGVGIQPALAPARLSLWLDCFQPKDGPRLVQALALDRDVSWTADFVELNQIEDYLRQVGAGDGEILCYSPSALSLLNNLGLQHGSRYLYPSVFVALIPRKADELAAELVETMALYAIVDTRDPNYTLRPRDFPFHEPILLDTGRYHLHRLRPRPERSPGKP